MMGNKAINDNVFDGLACELGNADGQRFTALGDDVTVVFLAEMKTYL